MGLKRKRSNRKSLFYVSIKNLILFLVIPVIIIYIISNAILIKFVYDDMIDSNNLLLEQISTSVNDNVNTAAMITASIASDKAIDNLLFQWNKESDWHLRYDMDARIQQLISAHLNYNNIYEGIGFKLKNDKWYDYGNTTGIHKYINENEIEKGENNKVNIVNEYINGDKLLLTIKISNRLTVVDSVWLVVNEDVIDLEKISNEATLKDVIVVKKNIETLEGRQIQIKDNRVYYYIKDKLDYFPYEIIGLYEITDRVYLSLQIIGLFIIGIVIIVLALLIYYKRYKETILFPITNTLENIKYIRKNGELEELFQSNNVEELNDLNHHLNKMIRQLRSLMEDNKRIGEEKLEVEVTVLQSQITSHFIFNTLNAIRILALTHDDIEVAKTIKNFSGLLKNNFTNGNMHTLENEVANIKNYCEIMKMRFGEKFNLKINLDQNIKDFKILKLIIQPIIENSITHGFIYPEVHSVINMNIALNNNKIKIEILDNGIGISKEVIREIINGKVGGIAIYNSNKRIKLYYGSEYGISIKSEQGKYTKTTVILPVIE